ncbi:MAG: hypothetical protein ACP6IU_15005 [Candidatus Asgardarchaeia archaeon]
MLGLKGLKGLKRHKLQIFIVLLFLAFLFSQPHQTMAKASNFTVEDIIVVGKVSQYDGTLFLLWYSEQDNQYVIQDYDLIGVDQVHLLIYSPDNLGATINITLISYYPIINASTGEEIGRENYKEVNISVAIPHVKTVIDKIIDLSTTNRTEKIIITYYDVSFVFYHKTATQYLKQVWTLGDIAKTMLVHIALTGVIASISIRHSKKILNKVKYFPKLSWWHVLIIGGTLFGSYYYLLNYAFDIYLRYQYLLIYGVIYCAFLLLSLHTFSHDPKIWLLIHFPRQEPQAKVFKIWIRFLYADKIEDKLIRIRKTWRSFIARLLGKYEYIEIYNYPLPVDEISKSFDRVVFIAKPAEVTEISFSTSGLVKLLLWIGVFCLAIISIFVFVPIVGIIITIVILIVGLILIKKGKLQLKEKMGNLLFKEGKTVLECTNEKPIDMLNWLYEYISTEDISAAKEENRRKYLQVKAQLEVLSDQKGEEIFEIYKEARDNRLKVQIDMKEPKIIQKKLKTTPEPELEEEKQTEEGDENE